MPSKSSLVALSGLAATTVARTCERGPAEVITNPLGLQAIATLPQTEEHTVMGQVVASSAAGGVGVNFYITMDNLPYGLEPFTYHVHDQPVSNDDCDTTLAHQDPYICGEEPPCDPEDPANCQVGDLAGKHGSIPGLSFNTLYTDPYTSLVQGLGSFIGNRSIVVHDKDGNRITCANFVMHNYGVTPNATSSYGTGVYPPHSSTAPPSTKPTYHSPSPSSTTVPSPPSPPPTGSAATFFVSAGVVALAFAALLL